MDLAKGIESDLKALRILYGLVRNDEDSVSNLDEHARFLLKNLLDADTKRVLKAYAQMIGVQVEAPLSVSPIPTPQVDGIVGEAVSQKFGKEQGSDQKRKDRQDMWTQHRFSPEQNVGASIPEYQKKRCMVCRKSTIKQLEFVRESNSVGAGENLNNYTYFELQQNNQAEPPLENKDQELGSVVFNRNCDYREMGKQKGPRTSNSRGFTGFSSESGIESQEGNCITKEASEVIKEIDSCIESLRQGADHLNLFEPNNIMRLSSSQFTRIRSQALEGSSSREPVEERNMHTQEVNADRQKGKRIIEKIESGKWRTNHNNFLPGEIRSQDKRTFNGVPDLPTTMKDKKGHVMFQPYMPLENSPQLITTRNVRKYPSTGRCISASIKNGLPENRNYYMKSGRSVRRQELEKTASPISYSSNSSSEQDSTYGSETEDYSSGTNSEEYTSPSSEIQSQYSTSTSNREEDVYASSGSDEVSEMASSNSSRSDGNSSYNHRTVQSRLKEPRVQIHKPANGMNPKKQSGTWNRLKEGLAVVFHHHQHHHFDKGKSVISKREAEACGEKAAEKIMRRSIIRGKKKQNNFHGIMEAVMSHLCRSKKNEVEKMVPLTKGQCGNKHAVKKSKQGLWKVGVGRQKSRLKALPKIK